MNYKKKITKKLKDINFLLKIIDISCFVDFIRENENGMLILTPPQNEKGIPIPYEIELKNDGDSIRYYDIKYFLEYMLNFKDTTTLKMFESLVNIHIIQ